MAQSVPVVHGHGAFAPPHAWQVLVPVLQMLPVEQSLVVEHPLGAPASVPGAVHVPDVHTVPWAHSLVAAQVCAQPLVVHTDPVGQLALPVHDFAGGGVTALHP